MSKERVSILIPTLNGMATLPEVLEAIRQQHFSSELELVAVDSGSTDGTCDFLRSRVDCLIQITRDQFNHGLTRNLGIERCSGELVVLLVQDAKPASASWLTALIAPFIGDDSLAGTFARHLPRPEASRITRRMARRWVTAQDRPARKRLENREALHDLAPLERLRSCAFDNVCACISRAVWQRHPFPRALFAEDLEWAKTVMEQGYPVAYVPEATVYHSHERSVSYEFKRTYLAHHRLYQLFGLCTIPSLHSLGRSLGVSLWDHASCLLQEPGPTPEIAEIFRTLELALAWPVGQYLGALTAKRGWAAVPSRGV